MPKLDSGPDYSHWLFTSPNTDQHVSVDQAITRLRGQEQKAAFQVARDIMDAAGLGQDTESYNAVGGWHTPEGQHYAENSVVHTIQGQHNDDLIRYLAARHGLHHNQEGVITFKSDPTGKDALYQVSVPDVPTKDLIESLKTNGLEYHTLIPHKSGHTVIIADQGKQKQKNIEGFANEHSTSIKQANGFIEFLGGSSRTAARKAYRQTIKGYEGESVEPSVRNDSSGSGRVKKVQYSLHNVVSILDNLPQEHKLIVASSWGNRLDGNKKAPHISKMWGEHRRIQDALDEANSLETPDQPWLRSAVLHFHPQGKHAWDSTRTDWQRITPALIGKKFDIYRGKRLRRLQELVKTVNTSKTSGQIQLGKIAQLLGLTKLDTTHPTKKPLPLRFAKVLRLNRVGPVLRYESGVHAPKGGVTIRGTEYRGGEFIPGTEIEKASKGERQELRDKSANESADVKPKSRAARILTGLKNIPAKTLSKAKAYAAKKYQAAEKKYGSKWAKAIVAAAVAMLPLPGSIVLSPLASAAVAGLAELHLRLSKKHKFQYGMVSAADVEKLGQKFLVDYFNLFGLSVAKLLGPKQFR